MSGIVAYYTMLVREEAFWAAMEWLERIWRYVLVQPIENG